MVDNPKQKSNEQFTKFVDNWLHEWTGWSIESIFEVNSIVVNPELVFFSNYNKGVFDYCESIGIILILLHLDTDTFGMAGCIV